MAQLTGDRKFTDRGYGDRNFPVAAGTTIWANALVAIAVATGLLKRAGGASGLPTDVVVGWARFRADNAGGGASAISCEVQSDTIRPMFNSGGGDTITLADVGKTCYAVDDQTVALTDGTGTRAPAGLIHNVTELGVWLRIVK